MTQTDPNAPTAPGCTFIEYCAEEVRRQGFNTNEFKGLKRVGWMIDAWTYTMWRTYGTADKRFIRSRTATGASARFFLTGRTEPFVGKGRDRREKEAS